MFAAEKCPTFTKISTLYYMVHLESLKPESRNASVVPIETRRTDRKKK